MAIQLREPVTTTTAVSVVVARRCHMTDAGEMTIRRGSQVRCEMSEQRVKNGPRERTPGTNRTEAFR